MRKINKRKLRDELFYVGTMVLGIILLVLNCFKIVPGLENPLAIGITTVIAYLGFPLGIFFTAIGFMEFLEVHNKKYSRKKTRR